MRPLKLSMKAFISYKENQDIDFTRFTDGLFLVDGDIGAGKTTIFDAISYALFGEPSGDGRDTDDLHCNLVPKSTDTEVKLTFSQGGKEYTVTRIIHYPKTRGTADQYDKPKPDALLEIPGKDPVKNPGKVNKKIESIIGLNKAQFEKIVMLAQGEFRKFLEASSTDKEAILKKLIDISEYEKYQEILAESHKRLKKLREDNDTAIRNHMETAFIYPDIEGFEREMFLPGNPALLDNLFVLKETDETAVTGLKDEHAKKLEAVKKLTTDKVKAKNDNQNISDLAKSREHLAALQEKAPEMETLRCRHESVSVVTNKILHVIKKRDEQDNKDKDLSNEISVLGAELNKLKTDSDAAARDVEGDKKAIGEVEQLKAESAAKAALLSKYDEHSTLTGKIDTKEKKIISDRELLTRTINNRKEQEALLEKAVAEKEAFEDPYSEVLNAWNAVDESKKKLGSFTELKTLWQTIESDENELKKLNEKVASKREESLARKAEFDRMYSTLMRERAAVLAKDLGIKIEESGEADCPVCGTHFVKGTPINLAKAEGDLISEDDVDKARNIFDAANEEYSKLNTGYEASKATLKTQKENAVKDCNALFNCSITWEDLTKEFLDEKSQMLDDEVAACEASLKQADEAAAISENLKGLIEKLKEEITKYQNKETEYSTTIANVSKEVEDLKKQEAALKLELEFDSKEKAEAQIKELEKKAKSMQEVIDKNKALLDKLTGEQTAKKTSLAEKTSYRENLAKEIEKTAKELNEVLAANHFSTKDDALAIIDDIEDPEAWIKKTSEELNSYKNDVENTKKKITELEEKTAGLKPVDLAVLDEAISKAETERDECNERLRIRSSLLDNHAKAYNVVKENKEKNAGTERAWNILNRLSPMAVGSSSDNGKLSFERYILGAFFSELLDKANRKLIDLTAGQYHLNHRTTGDRRNEAAGLDVEILNMSESSIISKGSLSGGEKFLTSLSLALGLSELAQDHFGGQTLDSLFIDEGFGTLDDKSLNLTMNVLNSLAGNNSRLVGIISHVDVSDYPIPHKIHVEKRGSASVITKMG